MFQVLSSDPPLKTSGDLKRGRIIPMRAEAAEGSFQHSINCNHGQCSALSVSPCVLLWAWREVLDAVSQGIRGFMHIRPQGSLLFKRLL